MTIEPFAAAHLRGMRLQAAQAYLQPYFAAGYAEFLAAGSEAPRSVLIDGQVVACMGIAEELGIGRLMWCFLSADVGRHMVRVYRCLREFAREHASPHLYATTEEGFWPGVRMLRLAGFELVRVLEAHGPDGRNHLLFAQP